MSNDKASKYSAMTWKSTRKTTWATDFSVANVFHLSWKVCLLAAMLAAVGSWVCASRLSDKDIKTGTANEPLVRMEIENLKGDRTLDTWLSNGRKYIFENSKSNGKCKNEVSCVFWSTSSSERILDCSNEWYYEPTPSYISSIISSIRSQSSEPSAKMMKWRRDAFTHVTLRLDIKVSGETYYYELEKNKQTFHNMFWKLSENEYVVCKDNSEVEDQEKVYRNLVEKLKARDKK